MGWIELSWQIRVGEEVIGYHILRRHSTEHARINTHDSTFTLTAYWLKYSVRQCRTSTSLCLYPIKGH